MKVKNKVNESDEKRRCSAFKSPRFVADPLEYDPFKGPKSWSFDYERIIDQCETLYSGSTTFYFFKKIYFSLNETALYKDQIALVEVLTHDLEADTKKEKSDPETIKAATDLLRLLSLEINQKWQYGNVRRVINVKLLKFENLRADQHFKKHLKSLDEFNVNRKDQYPFLMSQT